MTDKIIIKNAHCVYFEGQTGLCKAKEFTKCNPVNCKLYTIDELSTILELQEKLQAKELELEKYKKQFKSDTRELERVEQQDIRDAEYAEILQESLVNVNEKLDKAKQCILNAVSDFNIEIGTPQYEALLKGAKELGLLNIGENQCEQ